MGKIKEFFVKVSWIDPTQPLLRASMNEKVEVDFSQNAYKIVDDIHIDIRGKKLAADDRDFTVDMMVPTGYERE